MQQPPINLPRFLFEDCLALLRGLVVLAWVGVGAALGAEIWVRCLSGHDWPQLGGFSYTYNAVLLEFALNTVVLTLLLVHKDWYERIPRTSLHRLRWLLFAVLVWEGLHLFGAFHVTGSFRGPLLPMLPVVLAAGLIFLPGRAGWWLAAYLLAGHISVVLLESTGRIHARGLLADVFSLHQPGASLGVPVLAGVLASAIALGALARRWMYPDADLLSQAQRLDHATGLFRRAFLDQRIAAELGRTRRQGGQLGLLLLAPGDGATVTETELRNLAQRLLGMLRLESDTPARFAPGILAILLPAADEAGLAAIVQRITRELSKGDNAVGLRAAAAVTDGKGVDGARLLRAVEDGLKAAVVGADVPAVRVGGA